MSKTTIEWATDVWNPVTGCTRVSKGCARCYIERTPPFRMAGRRFSHGKDGGSTGLAFHPERLQQPLRWRKPRRVFVNSLSDLFHEEIPFEFIVRVFETMRVADQHVFQVLTKRPERAREVVRRYYELVAQAAWGEPVPLSDGFSGLPNVWLGVSIENARFTWRADVLREIPAAVRFISAEPLLGSLFPDTRRPAEGESRGSGQESDSLGQPDRAGRHGVRGAAPLSLDGIDWVIVGGESGPGARPMHPDWAREIRDACHADDPEGCYCDGLVEDCHGQCHTAFFFKQWGEWAPESRHPDYAYVQEHRARALGDVGYRPGDLDGAMMARVGKKAAGRLLDGRVWEEYPCPREAVPA